MKKNKKYPHEVFLSENKIKRSALPMQLQKRIDGFEEVQENLEHALDEDYDGLVKKLDQLSLELEEDLYDEFEDELTNNEEEFELEPGSIYRFSHGFSWKIISKKDGKRLLAADKEVFAIDPADESERVIDNLSALENAPFLAIEHKDAPVVKKSNDEEILDKLSAEGKNQISKDELKKLGFQSPLKKSRIKIGKYHLYKAVFAYTYTIKKG